MNQQMEDSLARRALSRSVLAAFAVVLMLFAALPARAESRALLVGVSGYAERPLKGPRNDVRRMRQLLEQRAFAPANILTLADGVPGARNPTRGAILGALDDLAARSRAGDTVFLYFAGHGSQQPADPGTPQGRAEPDGLHETFLPLDVGRWDGQAGTVRNALIDFELREKVDRIVARGAFVWAVFDACHAATLVRGVPVEDADIRQRRVDPLALGVPQELLNATRSVASTPALASPPAGAGARQHDGQAVYFYAAQTTEATLEMRLPPGEPRGEHRGLFSHVLERALSMDRPMTYRQLAQAILALYGSMNQTDSTPLFAGNGLDRMVWGQSIAPVRQWPVSRERMTVPAGTLAGLAEGSRFALLPHAAAGLGQAVGLLQAVRVGPDEAQLEPLGTAGRPPIRPDLIPAGAHARLIGTLERYSLRVAADDRACPAGCRWRPALDALRTQGVPGIDLQWVAGAGDLSLRFGEHELVGLPPGASAQPACASPGRSCATLSRGIVLLSAADGIDPGRLARRLGDRLHAVSRTSNLLRIAATAALAEGPGVEARLWVQPRGADAAGRRMASAETVARAEAGDQLVVSLHNRGRVPADVTLLYLDANQGISVLFPSRAGEVNRLEPGAPLVIDDIQLNTDNGVFGLERLLVIAVEAERQTERADFTFLAQPPLLAAQRRDLALDDEMGALFDAVFPGMRNLGEAPRLPSRRTRMMVFGVDLVPARGAKAR